MSDETEKRADPKENVRLSVDEAADKIAESMAEVQEETQAEPTAAEVPAEPSGHEIAQGQLAAYQVQLERESAAIQQAKAATQELRKEDPAEYAARMLEINDRSGALAQHYAQYSQAVQNYDSGAIDKATKELAKEQERLKEMIPDWPNQKPKLITYLRKQGYSDQQLSSVTDAKTVKIAWDAMQQAEAPKKKPLPRIPGKQKAQKPTIEQRAKKANIRPGSIAYQAMKIQELI